MERHMDNTDSHTEDAYPGSIFSLTDHEIYVVTARHEGRDSGQIATWIMPATLVPDRPRVVIVLSPRNFTHGLIAASGRFVLNMLAEEQHAFVPLFGLYSTRDRDKFAGLDIERTPSGIAVPGGSCGWAECRIISAMDLGDRIVYAADVVEQQVHPGTTPLRKRAAFALQPEDIRRRLEEKHRIDGARDSSLIKRFDP
jgi:flavin reductase (DIM6/NTAB) family NADH-FMN oxidoreductase RutF